jgi:hypothetical protein
MNLNKEADELMKLIMESVIGMEQELRKILVLVVI